MCGIAAIISSEKSEILSNIKPMCDVIRHRGPDDEGYVLLSAGKEELYGGDDTPCFVYKSCLRYCPDVKIGTSNSKKSESRIAMGHRRLSIIDLSPGGHQPMSCSDGRYWITYNGEIYNYLELKEELGRLNYTFVSNSDTEVILAAYAQWKEKCLEKFNGMWSFVIFDSFENRIFASRDRYGIKPIYYWQPDETSIVFASEIKQFTVFPQWKAVMEPQVCFDYLAYSLIDHTKRTMFKNVYQLRGGEYCLFDACKIEIKAEKWYKLSTVALSSNVCKVKSLFKAAIKKRLRSDVKLGACLSGGIDSSAIVCMADKIIKQNSKKYKRGCLETVSSCFEEKRFDERQYIAEVEKNARIKAHKVFPNMGTLFNEIEALVWHQDEPFVSTSIFAQWNVFKKASDEKIKVMLDGQGADEILAGYRTFYPALLVGYLKKGKLWAAIKEILSAKNKCNFNVLFQVKDVAKLVLLSSCLYRFLYYFIGGQFKQYLNYKTFQKLNVDVRSGRSRYAPNSTSIKQLSYSELKYLRLPALLHYEDRNSMAFSVESRVPFLDYQFVEHILSLPDELKIKNSETKYIFRHAMKNILPDQIRKRFDKMGFVTNEESWMKESSEFVKKLEEACDDLHWLFSKKKTLKRYKGIVNNNLPFDSCLWQIICFHLWIKKFDVKIK